MDIREIDATFHGRDVIQVNEFFFADTQMGTEEQGPRWVSDQEITVVYKGCLYLRVDQTGEFYQLTHPDFVPPAVGSTVQILHMDGRIEESELLAAEPSCHHAA
jgi:hypothetical protein